MTDSRFFSNPYSDFSGKQSGGLRNDNIKGSITHLLNEIDRAIDHNHFPSEDYSVYTGLAGAAYLHYMLAKHSPNDSRKHILAAEKLIRSCCSRQALRSKRVTFLCGDAGPLALNAVISSKLGNQAIVDESVSKLIGLLDLTINSRDMPDELLYGRSGYLYALLFVRHELGSSNAAARNLFLTEINTVCTKIIESGRELAASMLSHLRNPPPLLWQWHDKMYLGAAHGVAGILHTLLLAHDIAPSVRSIAEKKIPQTIDWLLSQRFQSGNLMSSVGSSSGDKLVQWCHGATALPHLLVRFIDLFPGNSERANRYRAAALEAGDVIWQRGLLTKGYGICHGTAGNAYSFLALYKATKDEKHLYRAEKFSEWCITKDNRKARTPDRPFSLFEGSAGMVWYLADMVFNLQSASFPAYEL